MCSEENFPFVSIIIPCKEIDDYARECIEHCKKLDYPSSRYEIIVLPDYEPKTGIEGVKVVSTGPITPGAKRNVGLKVACGDICAFIDSDAYPRRDWLKKAVSHLLGDERVVAIGGPAVTPPHDSVMQRCSGYVLSSAIMGSLARRYKVTGTVDSDDVHSCNLIVKREAIEKVGGWNEKYWPGEDTLLCLSLSSVGRIMEVCDVVVYHHRKPLFREHLRQVSRFALHRGFFAKKFRGNSLKPVYFAPSFLTFFLLLGTPVSMFIRYLRPIFLALILAYLIACLFSSVVETKEKKYTPIVFIGTLLTHLVYGIFFFLGLLKRDLER